MKKRLCRQLLICTIACNTMKKILIPLQFSSVQRSFVYGDIKTELSQAAAHQQRSYSQFFKLGVRAEAREAPQETTFPFRFPPTESCIWWKKKNLGTTAIALSLKWEARIKWRSVHSREYRGFRELQWDQQDLIHPVKENGGASTGAGGPVTSLQNERPTATVLIRNPHWPSRRWDQKDQEDQGDRWDPERDRRK